MLFDRERKPPINCTTESKQVQSLAVIAREASRVTGLIENFGSPGWMQTICFYSEKIEYFGPQPLRYCHSILSFLNAAGVNYDGFETRKSQVCLKSEKPPRRAAFLYR